jgi:hypothetical protein
MSRIEHVVRWWLTDPDDAPGRARFAAAASKLAELPGISRVSVGSPTPIDWRGPDQSWDVGFIVTFDSYDAVTGYMAHPLHQAVVDLAGSLADRVDVFYLDHDQDHDHDHDHDQ